MLVLKAVKHGQQAGVLGPPTPPCTRDQSYSTAGKVGGVVASGHACLVVWSSNHAHT